MYLSGVCVPANLSPEAKGKWNKVLMAKTAQEKLSALEEFLSSVPKHKGNERLRAQVKHKISTLKLDIESGRKRRAFGSAVRDFITKTGAAQLVIIGATKTGRSSLLSALTNAKPVIAGFEFATTEPTVGMFPYEDVQFQLVEAPALLDGASRGIGLGSLVMGLARKADALIITVDLSQDSVGQFETVKRELENSGISLEKPSSDIEIDRKATIQGIHLVVRGSLVDCNLEDIKKLLESYGVKNAVVEIRGSVRISNVEDAILESVMIHKPALIVANKADVVESKQELDRLRTAVRDKLPIVSVSCLTGKGLSDLGRVAFKTLGLMRVYTKEPNDSKASKEPFIMSEGTRVGDLAQCIHSQLYSNFRYARIWGPSSKYAGERVGLSHYLKDGDIVEIHAK